MSAATLATWQARASTLQLRHQAFIDGQFVDAQGGQTFATLNPANGQKLADVAACQPADVDRAVQAARRAFESGVWAQQHPRERKRVLLRLAALIDQHSEELALLETLDMGKPISDALAYDLPETATCFAWYAEAIDKQYDEIAPTGPDALATITREPLGVVAAVVPWNYPLMMASWKVAPALAAGNSVLLKPAEQSPLSALRLAELAAEAGIPPGVFNVLPGLGPVTGQALGLHMDVDCLAFTGSTATGKRVAAQAAERLIGCSLELGGKNPLLVLRDASIERASEGAVRACFSNAGQLCVSTERLFIADEVYDQFVARLVARTEALTLGAGHDWAIDMGSLISQDQLDTVVRHVEDAVAKGATVLTGGKHRPDLGPFFYEPTILEGVTPDMECYGNETFGPVVAVHRFQDETEAISLANEGTYGLNAAVFSKDGKRARAIAREIKCGTVNINEGYGATFGSIDAPMGGMRESGMGRRQGAEGIHRYTEAQAVATQRVWGFTPPPGVSNELFAKVLTLNERVMGKIGRA